MLVIEESTIAQMHCGQVEMYDCWGVRLKGMMKICLLARQNSERTKKAIDTRPALNRFQVIQTSIIKIPVDFEFIWCTQMTRKKNNFSRSHAEKNAAFYVKRMLVPGKNLRSPPPARSILKVSC